MGVEGALNYLIDYDKVEEGFDILPWEFCWEPDTTEVYVEPPRFTLWWTLRMLMTRRPLQEKLTLFWHDHFAVSAAKVEFGPAMLTYNETLRRHAAGNYRRLLGAMSRDPAMIRWLDMDSSIKGSPNENFARELLELFTLGPGHYSEADIKETARAFTGYGIRYLIFESGGEQVQEKIKEAIRLGRPMLAYAYSQDLHDDGPKTLLGKTSDFSGDAVLDLLAARPETARHVCRKLWEWFAYPDPEPSVVERLAKAFQDSGGEIRPVLRAIAASPEFWSEKCFRRLVKNPADFVLPVARQLELHPLLLTMRGQKDPTKPLAKPLRDGTGIAFAPMYQQGMFLLYPPNVGGWEGGTAWVSSHNMLERMKLPSLLFAKYDGGYPLAGWLAMKIASEHRPKDSAGVVEALAAIFDVPLEPDQAAVALQACEKAGGAAALASPETAARLFENVCRLFFGAPSFQFC